jgi:uncharacterized protein YqeY
MELFNRINQDIKKAMLARDSERLETLRSMKSALMLLRTEAKDKELSGEEEVMALQRLLKQRRESADIFKEQGREDLYLKELAEGKIIEEYLPAQISEEELESEIKKVIQEVGAVNRSDMGKVMGMASKKMAGRADGKTMAEIVKRLLP